MATAVGTIGLLAEEGTGLGESKKSLGRNIGEVSPVEDLMREHGVLNRVLLIYDEILARLTGGIEFSPDILLGAGEAFEDKEHALFGKNGFREIVAEVATLEKRLGIYSLSQFTAKV
jgi:hypothetical protein